MTGEITTQQKATKPIIYEKTERNEIIKRQKKNLISVKKKKKKRREKSNVNICKGNNLNVKGYIEAVQQ